MSSCLAVVVPSQPYQMVVLLSAAKVLDCLNHTNHKNACKE